MSVRCYWIILLDSSWI